MTEKGKHIPIFDKDQKLANTLASSILFGLSHRYPDLAEEIKKHTLSVLDVGTGRGGMLESFRKSGLTKVVGIDYNKISGQKETGAMRADAHFLPFQDESFNLVTSLGAFESALYPNDLSKILKEIHRVLKPGGVMVASDGLDFRLTPPELHNLFEEIDMVGAWRKK